MLRLFLLLSFSIVSLVAMAQSAVPIDIIAFGSCNDEDLDQRMWSAITPNHPDLWIWLGDVIYGDSEIIEVIRNKYDKQLEHPEYQQFLEVVPHVIGTWDDHDYGTNDGDKNWHCKAETKGEFLRFIGTSETNKVYDHSGIYTSYEYGSPGQKVKVILLDTRYFRDELKKDRSGKNRYLINETGDMLGDEQWTWLEQELNTSDAQLNLLVSSVQVIPSEQKYEKWANFPAARKRLYHILRKHSDKNILILSGDRHVAEMSRLNLGDKLIYELTSSGLTHTWPTNRKEPNRYRDGELIIKRNFALLELDWQEKAIHVTAQVRGLKNTLFQEWKLTYPLH